MNIEQRARELLAKEATEAGWPRWAAAIREGRTDSIDAITIKAITRALEQREAVPMYGPGSNTGHGHVWRRPDGVTARCGGPVLCLGCRADAKFYATPPRDVPDGFTELQKFVEEARIAYQGQHASGTFREVGRRLAALAAAPSGDAA